jgi:predicted protein tyrosine phosphatase
MDKTAVTEDPPVRAKGKAQTKLTNVVFVDRDTAEDLAGQSNWAVISITEPGTYQATLKQGWHSVLRLEFHDVEEEIEPNVWFDEAMARQVIDFGKAVKDEVGGIMVHCRQGISRSAAIAKWIALRHELRLFERYDRHNKLVYRLLIDMEAR